MERHGVALVLFAVILTVNAPIAAQDVVPQAPPPGQAARPPRPVRPLFGGNERDPNSRQSLDVRFSASGSYDDNVYLSQLMSGRGGGYDPRTAKAGAFSMGDAALSYNKRSDRVSALASFNTGIDYFTERAEATATNYGGNASVSVLVSPRVTVTATGAASSTPYYSIGLFLGQLPLAQGTVPILYYGLIASRNVTMFGTANMSARLTRSTTFDVVYERRDVRYTALDRSFAEQAGGASLRRRLARNLSIRAGYTNRRQDYGLFYAASAPVTQHDIDAGIDYEGALSRTQRTRFGFSTGAAVYTTGPTSLDPNRRYYRVIGNAHILHDIGQSWVARADYRRGLQVSRLVPEPIFSDQVALSAGGYATARTHLLFEGAYTNGEPGLGVRTWRFDTYTGRAQLQFALSRQVAFSLQYLYYHYDFGNDYQMPVELPGRLNRQAVTVGVNFWVPLLRW